MNVKSFLHFTGILVALFAFSGCNMLIQDLTPTQLEQNPSSIYTFTFKVNADQTNIIEESMEADIVIDGETYDMTKAGPRLFEYDFRANPTEDSVRYYYVLEYDYESSGVTKHAVKYSTDFEPNNQVYEAHIVNRYVIKLVSNRGPVGATIDVVGRGFSEFDKILIGGQEAETNFKSPNAMNFVVPNMRSGPVYPVFLRTADGDIDGGTFRIDPAVLSVMPAEINVPVGEQELVNFTLPFAAPSGGLTLDVTTDIPNSVIMPEVVVPAGEMGTTVFIEGGSPGSGYLFVEGQGFDGISVPINVIGQGQGGASQSGSMNNESGAAFAGEEENSGASQQASEPAPSGESGLLQPVDNGNAPESGGVSEEAAEGEGYNLFE